jgi:hypothetical protein
LLKSLSVEKKIYQQFVDTKGSLLFSNDLAAVKMKLVMWDVVEGRGVGWVRCGFAYLAVPSFLCTNKASNEHVSLRP